MERAVRRRLAGACFTQAAQAPPTRRIATAATNPNLTSIIIETDGGARVVSVS